MASITQSSKATISLPLPNENLSHVKSAWEFYNNTLLSGKFFAAPMVNQSELPYRMLVRKYNCKVAVTPMIHSRIFQESKKYRKSAFSTCDQDRPLIVQFCGNDPDILLNAAKYVENSCDAVDLNLGCPQGIARKGNYGAYLLTETDLLCKIVAKLHQNLSIPVTCKIRLLPKLSDTLELCLALEKAGCSLLTVHGRTKEQKQQQVGFCDWKSIGIIKDLLQIPVIANGGIANIKDVYNCLKETDADGVMSSEALLENPSLFAQALCISSGNSCGGGDDSTSNNGIMTNNSSNNSVESMQIFKTIQKSLHERQVQLSYEYMEFVKLYPTHKSNVRAHLNKFLYSSFVAFESHPTVKHARQLLNTPKKKETWYNDYLKVVDFIHSVVSEMKGKNMLDIQSSSSNNNGSSSTVLCAATTTTTPKHLNISPGKWYSRHRDIKRKAEEKQKLMPKRPKVPFTLFDFKRQYRVGDRVFMVFVLAGMEDLAVEEIYNKLNDLKSKDEIVRVGHYEYPVGTTGGKTEVCKLVFETSASFQVLRTLRTIQCLFSFIAAGDGLVYDKVRTFEMLNKSIVMDDGTNRLTDQFQEAIQTWQGYDKYLVDDDVKADNNNNDNDNDDDNNNTNNNGNNNNVMDKIKFRASCLRSGKHEFNSQHVAVHLGGKVYDIKSPNWSVSLKKYDMEIYILIMQSSFVIGIPLPCYENKAQLRSLKGTSNLPRESRPLLPFKRADSMLRPSTAHLMVLLAKIKAGDFVIDPMCGGGTIPIESSVMYGSFDSDIFSMAGDIDENCVSITLQNLKSASISSKKIGSVNLKNGIRYYNDISSPLSLEPLHENDEDKKKQGKERYLGCDIVRWNVLNMPLRSGVVDAIVCDLPFDMKCKMKKQHFPLIFREIFRILRVGGRAVLLVRWKNLFIDIVEKTETSIIIERKIDVCVGGTIVTLFVVIKRQ